MGAIIKSNRDRKSLLQHPEHAAEESRWLIAEKRQLDLVIRRYLTGTFQEKLFNTVMRGKPYYTAKV